MNLKQKLQSKLSKKHLKNLTLDVKVIPKFMTEQVVGGCRDDESTLGSTRPNPGLKIH